MAGGKTYNHNIKIKTDVDVKGVDQLGSSLEKVVKWSDKANDKLKNLDLKINVNTGKSIQELNDLAGQISNIEKNVKSIKNPKIKVFDSNSSKAVIGLTSNIGNFQKSLKGINGKQLKGVAAEADKLTKSLESATTAAGHLSDAIQSVGGVNLGGAVSQANALAKAYENASHSASNTAKNSKSIKGSDGTGGGRSGGSSGGINADMILGAAVGKSAYELTVENAATKETNKATMKTWKNYDPKVFDQIDKATDNATVTMNATVPSMNAFGAATGVDAKWLGEHAKTFTNLGTKVQALGYSEAEANNAMMDLAKGAQGAFASLDQYGISEEALKATNKWDGDADDLDGFMEAVDAVIGDTEAYENTLNWQLSQLKKDFSRGGATLGNLENSALSPFIKAFNNFDSGLYEKYGANIGTAVAAASQLASGLSLLRGTIDKVRQAGEDAKEVLDTFRSAKSKIKDFFKKDKKDEGPVDTGKHTPIEFPKQDDKGPLGDTCDDPCVDAWEKQKKSGFGGECDDDCLDTAEKVGKQKEKNGKTTKKNQKKHKKGVPDKNENILDTTLDMGIDSKKNKSKRKGKSKGKSKGLKSKLGGITDKIKNPLKKSGNIAKSGAKAGKGLLTGIGNAFKGGSGGLISKLTGPLGKAFTKVGGKLALGGLGKGLLACVPVVGTVISALWMLTDVLDMLGIDWFSPLKGGFDWLSNTVMSKLQPTIDWLMGVGQQVWGALSPVLNTIGHGILDILGNTFNNIVSDLQGVWETIGPGVTEFCQLIWQVGEAVWGILGPAFESLSESGIGLDTFSPLINMLRIVWPLISSVGGAVWGVLKSALMGLRDALNGIKDNGFVQWIQDAITKVTDFGSTISDKLQPVLDTLANFDLSGLLGWFSQIWDKVKGIADLVGKVTSFLSGANGSGAEESAGATPDSGGSIDVSSQLSQVQDIGSNLKTIFSNITTGIAEIVKGNIETIGDGINNVFMKIGDTITGVFSSIGNTIQQTALTITGCFMQVSSILPGMVANVFSLSASFLALSGSVIAFGATGTLALTSIAALAGLATISMTALSGATMLTLGFMTGLMAMTAVTSGFMTAMAASSLLISTNIMNASNSMSLFAQSVASATLSFTGFGLLVSGELLTAGAAITTFSSTMPSKMTSCANQMKDNFKNGLSGLSGAIDLEFSSAYDSMCAWGDKMIAKAGEIGASITSALSGAKGLNQGSPGDVYRAITNEFMWSNESMQNQGDTMATTAASVGRNIVTSYSENTNMTSVKTPQVMNPTITTPQMASKTNNNQTNNTSQPVINITVNGDIDSQDRINSLVRDLKRAFFEGKKAGRFVKVGGQG